MFRPVRFVAPAGGSNLRKLLTTVPAVLLIALSTTPVEVSCQRGPVDANRGIPELRSLVESQQGKPSADELTKFESKFPRTRSAALAHFLRGFLYYSAQNFPAAIDVLDAGTIGSNSELADYTLWYRAESEVGAGQKKSARSDYRELYTKYPDSLKAREARLRSAEMSLDLNDADAATKELDELISAGNPDALLLSAQAAEQRGQADKAITLYRKIYYDTPATVASTKAETRLAALGAAPREHPASFELESARAGALFAARQFGDAAGAYSDLLAKFPEAAKVDEVNLRLGISLLNSKEPAQSVAPLTKVGEQDASLKPQAMFNLAEALRRSNRAAEASLTVDRLLAQHPKSKWSEEALYSLASYLGKDRKVDSVARFRQLAALFPKSQYAPEATYTIGWQAYQNRSYADAARLLEQHLANYRSPETKYIGESGFWAAKSEERLGNRARALALYDLVNQRYRYGYHGYISGLRAEKLRAADPRLKPEQSKPGSDLEAIKTNVLFVEPIQETATGGETVQVSRANDLEVVGLTDDAVRELNKALEAAPSSPRLNLRLAQVYSVRGENFQATLILRRGYPDIYSYAEADVPREAWSIFFPLVAWPTIKEEAKRYGIDPYMAAGLIRQESVFNPNAVSRVGARGLMQVMPATGQQISKKQGGGTITAADLFNPSLNVKLGMNYLAQMLGQFGRIEYAAAAYNAGPGRAQRWISERGGLDIEDWIESIPFSETRGYVQGVLRYSANYRRLYKD
jgi:peptidoglycan lytic transglycosylase